MQLYDKPTRMIPVEGGKEKFQFTGGAVIDIISISIFVFCYFFLSLLKFEICFSDELLIKTLRNNVFDGRRKKTKRYLDFWRQQL